MREMRNEIAIRDKRIIELEAENVFLKGEIKGMIHRGKPEEMTTTQRFNQEMERRFSGWRWYRDNVLAGTLTNVQTGIVIAILYLAFGGKLHP